MVLFDLMFLGLALTAVVCVGWAIGEAVRGKFSRCLLILRRLGIGTVIYLAAVLAVSWATRSKTLQPGEPECNGEWCMMVVRAARAPDGHSVAATLRVLSTAKRVSMRENDVSVYLLDGRGNRYDPNPEPASPFNVLLGPGESADVERVFAVPPGAGNLGLVVRFGALAGFPGSLVIGENGWLHKPDRIVLGL